MEPPVFVRDDTVSPPVWYRLSRELSGAIVIWRDDGDIWTSCAVGKLDRGRYSGDAIPAAVLETVLERWG